jgi:hypothetical protein
MRIIFKRMKGVLMEGLFPKRKGPLVNGIRIALGVPLFGMLFLYIVLPDALPHTYARMPDPARFAGIAGSVCAITVIGLSHKALGCNYSSTVVIKKITALSPAEFAVMSGTQCTVHIFYFLYQHLSFQKTGL